MHRMQVNGSAKQIGLLATELKLSCLPVQHLEYIEISDRLAAQCSMWN